METPLTPLEFARRTRRLHPEREAVVDGDRRFTYDQLLDRCDRWSSGLQRLGVRQGDRVVYIAPNTHALLEGFYAVPQLGAVVVPLNYRLTPADFAYMINHCGARVVCAHSDHLEAVEGIRKELPAVELFVALEGARDGWLDYEARVASSPAAFARPPISERDLLTINYTSGTTSRPKGVMITHRNAYMNVVGTLIHISMSPADRYLWTLPMFHANGWTFVWIVTAVGGTHVCLRKVESRAIFTLIRVPCGAYFVALCTSPATTSAVRRRSPRTKTGCPPRGPASLCRRAIGATSRSAAVTVARRSKRVRRSESSGRSVRTPARIRSTS